VLLFLLPAGLRHAVVGYADHGHRGGAGAAARHRHWHARRRRRDWEPRSDPAISTALLNDHPVIARIDIAGHPVKQHIPQVLADPAIRSASGR
jgi:hypothetical protein